MNFNLYNLNLWNIIKKKKTKENLKILQRSSSVLTVTFTDHVPVDVKSAVAEPAEDPVTLKEESL